MSSLPANLQSSSPGALVALYRVDTSIVGGPVIFFVEGAQNDTGVHFGGQYYTPVDVEFSSFEVNSTGALPTPKLKLSNTNGVFQAIINEYGDLIGSTVQRVRTFDKYLDNGSAPDPTAFLGPDTFVVQRKASENIVFIEWELSAAIDQEGKQLPGRQIIRDTCLWRYRRWTGSKFDYTNVQCPYTGDKSYDFTNKVTTPDKDVCNRHISGCKIRFGALNPLPFGGFPGAGRTT